LVYPSFGVSQSLRGFARARAVGIFASFARRRDFFGLLSLSAA